MLGVDEAAVGRLARPDGSSQLTLGGWPVYVNRSDDGQLKQAARACSPRAGSRCPRRGEGRAAQLTGAPARRARKDQSATVGYRAPLPRVTSPDQRFSDQVTTRMVRKAMELSPASLAPRESSPVFRPTTASPGRRARTAGMVCAA